MAEISSPQITVSTASGGEAASTVSSSGNQITEELSLPVATTKKKRNQPGNPDPDAEVVALSPTSLLATNRFLCEICGKGFQRDQNLQLHRRGHNLPWKLRQRTSKEIKKRVYVCPEISCVHHDPKRALGDLTGIKKHFCRKHGEKKFKCERCSKKYAVQSDWKAHMKTCGSKEYKCDCGTVFSRRDSFVTHRAFCDALAQESAKTQVQVLSILGTDHKDVVMGGVGGGASGGGDDLAPSGSAAVVSSSSPPEATPFNSGLSPVLSVHSPDVPEHQSTGFAQPTSAGCSSSTSTSNANRPFPSIFAPASGLSLESSAPAQASYSNMFTSVTASGQEPTAFLLGSSMEPTSLSLSSLYQQLSNNNAPYINQASSPHDHRPFASQQPAMSATALLQKAAQMGATTSGSSMLNGFGLASVSSGQHEPNVVGPSVEWNNHVVTGTPENGRSVDGLGGGLPSDGEFMSSPGQVMGGFPGFYDSKPTTLDLLGLGGNGTTSGLPAFFTSINHGFGAADSGGGGDSFGCGVNPWENLTSERKSNETML